MPLHNPFAYPETQAGANILFRREKRLEDPASIDFRNSRSIVRNRDLDHIFVVRLPMPSGHSNINLASRRHCINTVLQKIGQDLP
jgi:hypothetical protein